MVSNIPFASLDHLVQPCSLAVSSAPACCREWDAAKSLTWVSAAEPTETAVFLVLFFFYVISIILTLKPKHGLVPSARKRMNSISGKTRMVIFRERTSFVVDFPGLPFKSSRSHLFNDFTDFSWLNESLKLLFCCIWMKDIWQACGFAKVCNYLWIKNTVHAKHSNIILGGTSGAGQLLFLHWLRMLLVLCMRLFF